MYLATLKKNQIDKMICSASFKNLTGLLDWTHGLDSWASFKTLSELLDWTHGLDSWTGLMDWAHGLGLDLWTGLKTNFSETTSPVHESSPSP
jgi:hypothetical protein